MLSRQGKLTNIIIPNTKLLKTEAAMLFNKHSQCNIHNTPCSKNQQDAPFTFNVFQ